MRFRPWQKAATVPVAPFSPEIMTLKIMTSKNNEFQKRLQPAQRKGWFQATKGSSQLSLKGQINFQFVATNAFCVWVILELFWVLYQLACKMSKGHIYWIEPLISYYIKKGTFCYKRQTVLHKSWKNTSQTIIVEIYFPEPSRNPSSS